MNSFGDQKLGHSTPSRRKQTGSWRCGQAVNLRLPPARLPALVLLLPFHTAPTAGDRVLSHMGLCGHLMFKTQETAGVPAPTALTEILMAQKSDRQTDRQTDGQMCEHAHTFGRM